MNDKGDRGSEVDQAANVVKVRSDTDEGLGTEVKLNMHVVTNNWIRMVTMKCVENILHVFLVFLLCDFLLFLFHAHP